jgi:hypothetical protein
MVSDSLELGAACGIRNQKQFLEYDRIHGETNAPLGFSGEQLGRRRLAPKVSNDHVRVQEDERSLSIRTFAPFERMKLRLLFHLSIVFESWPHS